MKYSWLILFFLTACRGQEADTPLLGKKQYFDLAGWVQKDIIANTQNAASEEKTVWINGKREFKQIDTVDWKKELQLLMECDINKPNWKGKYEIQQSNDFQVCTYSATSSKIPVRNMKVHFEQKSGKVQSIEIEKKIGTFLFSNQQYIYYTPGKSFKITARQSAVFMKDFNSEVEVKFITKASDKK